MKPTFAFVLALLCLAQTATAESNRRTATIITTSSDTLGLCEGRVSRSVSVCDGQGQCNNLSLDDELSFRVPQDGSITVSATTSGVNEAGVVYGSSAVDRFQVANGSTKLVQILQATQRCSYSYSYEIRLR